MKGCVNIRNLTRKEKRAAIAAREVNVSATANIRNTVRHILYGVTNTFQSRFDSKCTNCSAVLVKPFICIM